MFRTSRNIVVLSLTLLVASLNSGCTAKSRAARHLSRGDSYYSARDYAKAEIEYLNVLKADATNAHAIGQLGLIYCEEGRAARAYPFVMKACQLEPQSLELRLKACLLYLAAGNTTNASSEAAAVLARSPTNSEAPLLLAESARTTNSVAETRQKLETLQRQIGETAPVTVALGTLSLKMGDLEAAGASFKRAVALDPKSAAAHSALGFDQTRAGSFHSGRSRTRVGCGFAGRLGANHHRS